MKKLLLGAVAAFALAAPAAAFDNTTCKEFLAGTWEMSIDQDAGGQKAHIDVHSVYNEDGTFAQTMKVTVGGAAQPDNSRKGTWDAGPGPSADTCEATLTPEGSPADKVVLTVVDDNSVKGPEGHISTRAAE
ncbi:hypothetical protein sos41_01770 [Alphaproteobacteria bacterium SO-S41]|nr:hypothetical protein sos41_01770 [Alphaproteobacteria bacterium SO-S41]